MRGLTASVAAYAGALLLQTVQHALAPQRDGVAAIIQIGAPHLFLPLVVLVPLAFATRRRGLVALVLVASLVGLTRFGPGMVSVPAPGGPDETELRVATWNLAADAAMAEVIVERLLESDVELAALPELTHAHAEALEASARFRERFPYRLFLPHRGVLGMGLISAHPLRELQRASNPPHILASVELAEGATMITLAAHPLPSRFELAGGLLPTGYYAGDRDHDLAHLRSLLDHHLAAGERVLVLGDLNVTDREIGYASFTSGMWDAHRDAGLGPGSTWRPPRLAGLPIGILRIDYVLGGGPVRPIATTVECAPTGDHCILWAALAFR